MDTRDLMALVLIILFVVLVVVVPIPLYRFLRRWLAASIERRDFAGRAERLTDDQERRARRLFPFPIAGIINLILTGASLLVIYVSPIDVGNVVEKSLIEELYEPNELALQILWPFHIPALAFYLLTFREHVSPLVRRRRKYDYALSGIVTMWVAAAFYEATITASLAPLLVQPIIFLTLVIGTSAVLARLNPTDKMPSRLARRLHVLVKKITPVMVLFVLFFVPFVILPFLVARYRVVQWMEKFPILYLRSFSQADAPKIYREIISKVCNRYGVVYALVHTRQSAAELRGDSTFYEGSQLAATTDEEWKSVVFEKLQSASAVIIDDTAETAGIEWEVAEARQICDSSHIAILRKKESEKTSHPDLWHLEYEESKLGYEKARRDLRDWLAPIMLGGNSS